MSEQVLRSGNVMERSRTRTITQIAMLGALAGVLMNIEFPIPFLAPSFYQLDFSEIPVLVGTFAMGPVAGILIEVVKLNTIVTVDAALITNRTIRYAQFQIIKDIKILNESLLA